MQQKQKSLTPIVHIELSIDCSLDQCKRSNQKIKKTNKWPFVVFLFILFIVVVFLFYYKMSHLHFLNLGYQLQGGIEDELSTEIKQILKNNPRYDVHYFVDDKHTQMSEIVVKEPGFQIQSQVINEKRQIIHITHSEKSLNKIIKQMNNPYLRTKSFLKYKNQMRQPKYSENLQKLYFAYSLNKKPNSKQYLEAQYYRLNQLYQIGKYGEQLPFCVLLTGRNDGNSILRMYNSIKMQNYSNFHVVHIDDCSKDDTLQRVMNYLQNNAEFDHKVTIITQPYVRNALYNRDFGITNHCGQNDVIIDMDADDWLIGRQVFQLVNALYQKGNAYKGNNQDIWALYLNNMAITYEHKIPTSLFEGELPEQELQKGLYRVTANWRTTQLRTYLRKLYMKIDKNDYIDSAAIKSHEYFGLHSDAYMNNAMVELSGYKHLKFLDQYVYYYNRNDNLKKAIQYIYQSISSQILPPYEELLSLEDAPRRRQNLRAPDHYYQIYQQSRAQVVKKRKQIVQMIKNNKK